MTAQRIGPVELRVLGCLIEKQRTTPEQYPLTLNSLRLACNQSTNRDPVVDYDEAQIREALQQLGRIGWTRLATGPGSRGWRSTGTSSTRRSTLDHAETVILALLMLRGPQTAAELKARAERMRPFADVAEVTAHARRGWPSASSRCSSRGARASGRSAGCTCSARTSRTRAVRRRAPSRGPRASRRRRSSSVSLGSRRSSRS